VHRRPHGGDLEALSINLRAMPSFEAFGRLLETANPFVFWAQAMQMAWLPWLPWLGATRALTTPWSTALSPTRPRQSTNIDSEGR
jgi:hypothetical protein